jgi:hypothetical protein
MAFARLAFDARMALRTVLLSALLVLCSGCATHFIENTDVEDTDDNRRVIEFCEQYRRAVEMRNVPLLLKLADPRYYEDGGNVDATDDLDFAGLRDYLEDKFKQTRTIRYEIRYRRVGEGRKHSLFVDYTYSASYKIPTPSGDLWRRRVAENRLEIVPAGQSFRILSGM